MISLITAGIEIISVCHQRWRMPCRDCVSLCFRVCIPIPLRRERKSKAKELLERLFVYYLKHIDVLPAYYLQMLEEGEENDRVVCDYIAGMTDQYAVAKYNEYFMPKSWQVY